MSYKIIRFYDDSGRRRRAVNRKKNDLMRYEVRMIVETEDANIVDVFDVATEVKNGFVEWSEKIETATMVCEEDVFVIELDEALGREITRS